MEDMEFGRLSEAAERITLDEKAKERILADIRQKKCSRRRLALRVPASVLAACLLAALLCFIRPELIGKDAVIYAATEEHGWQKLKEGERILLKMEPFQTLEEGEEAFGKIGERCNYWPYKCTFRVEVPEQYVYDKQMVMIRDDDIFERGDTIEWWVGPERPEDAGRVMQGAFRLCIIDENLERQAALELELTKEEGKCYAELKRVWESKAYQKRRHKK